MQQLTTIQTLAVAVIPVLFAITLHEVAHGWVARGFGDRTAEMLGRLTINPLKHIDPIGTVLVPAILILMPTPYVFGWAKPVPVSMRNLRDPRRHMMIVAAAGPVSNMLMALFWALVAKLAIVGGLGGAPGVFVLAMTEWGILINILLAVFNLLPIPPLDGGRVLSGLLPGRYAAKFDTIEPYGMIVVLVLLFTGMLWPVLRPAMLLINRGITGLVGL
jgi:Zn-dependent protease